MLEGLVADAGVASIFKKNLVAVIEGGDAGDDGFTTLVGELIDGLEEGLGGAVGQAVGAEKDAAQIGNGVGFRSFGAEKADAGAQDAAGFGDPGFVGRVRGKFGGDPLQIEEFFGGVFVAQGGFG